MADDIKVLKLVTGEEIIAHVGTPHGIDDDLGLTKIRSIVMQQTGPNQVGLALVPWIASDPDAVATLRQSALLADPITPKSELEKEYLQQTTGIAIAT